MKDTRKSFIAKAKERNRRPNGSPRYCYERVRYRGSKTPVEIRCPRCSSQLPKGEVFYFSQRPNDHLGSANRRPAGCPLCAASQAESEIFFILRRLGVEVELQKTFDDLRNPETGRLLRYDFYLPEQRVAIEFNGIFHYDDKGFATPVSAQAYKFNLKKQYAQDNGIDFVVLSCFDEAPLYDTLENLFTDTTIPRNALI